MSGTVLRRGAIPEMMCMYAMKRGNMTCRKNQGQRISYFQSAYQDVSDLYIYNIHIHTKALTKIGRDKISLLVILRSREYCYNSIKNTYS